MPTVNVLSNHALEGCNIQVRLILSAYFPWQTLGLSQSSIVDGIPDLLGDAKELKHQPLMHRLPGACDVLSASEI